MNVRNGSMVLTCMFFISVCMIIMLLHWQSQEAMQQTLIMRTQRIQAEYAAQALLDYGIEICKKRYANLSNAMQDKRYPILIRCARWPIDDKRYAQGCIEISYTEHLQITATLENQQNIIRISCFLNKETSDQSNIFRISGWKRHEINAKK